MLIDAERSALDLDELIADEDEPAVAAITIAELGGLRTWTMWRPPRD